MDKIKKLESVKQFNAERGQKTFHPLVSVLDQSKSKPIHPAHYLSELYIIFLKDLKCADMKYGRGHYDYDDGTILFIAPGQVMGFDHSEKILQPSGWALAFHPDLIYGTSLGRRIKQYSFFSYGVTEALHVSDMERSITIECFKKIGYELEHAIDKHTKTLIVSNIELFLNYCVRFYDRQFLTRDTTHKDALVRFEVLLEDYYSSNKPQTLGLPTVAYCAEHLHLSANYFGDLIKKETGKSAQEYIHFKIIDLAKEKVFDESKSISEVAYEMGFKYPQHFARLFKQHTGQSPTEYRLLS